MQNRLTIFTLLLMFITLDVSAEPERVISPREILMVCESLPTYATIALNGKQSNVPEDFSADMTEKSMRKRLASLSEDMLDRYIVVVRDLFKRVYALESNDPKLMDQQMTQACANYAPDQYSAKDIKTLAICKTKTRPYLGFAKVRDDGMSLQEQLAWLKQDLAKKVKTPEQSDKLYAELSAIMQFVYSQPEKDKAPNAIFAEKFNSCVANSGR